MLLILAVKREKECIPYVTGTGQRFCCSFRTFLSTRAELWFLHVWRDLVKINAPVSLHVVLGVDLQVSVGVYGHQHRTDVRLDGEKTQKSQNMPKRLRLKGFQTGPEQHTHINEVLFEALAQVLYESCLAGVVLQQNKVLHAHPVSGCQGRLHHSPHPVASHHLGRKKQGGSADE